MFRMVRQFAIALPFCVAACGLSEYSYTTGPAPTLENEAWVSSLGVSLVTSTKLATGMYYRDITPGTGATVVAGQQLSVYYTGWLANGSQFGSNTTDTTPFVFKLGAGVVIPGWDQGVPGMKVGGTRQLIIPASLGYGAQGSGPIPPNSNLVFTVQVVSAQ